MSGIESEERVSTTSARLGVGSWIILIALVSVLFAACVVGYLGWRLADGVDVPISGYVAMVAGVIASLAVGFQLRHSSSTAAEKVMMNPPVLIIPDFKEHGSPSNRPD